MTRGGAPARVVLVHNFYQQPGGEDRVFAEEAQLLEERGHVVARHTVRNDVLAEWGPLRAASRTVWNRSAARELGALCAEVGANVVHFHNTFPIISPAAYYAARAAGAAVVQTLHNYRLLCPNALLFRDGRPCEACIGRRVPTPGIRHACYRNDRRASAVVAGMLVTHRALATWRRAVDLYIAPTEFARAKLVAGGLPGDRVAVKPHFVHPDLGAGVGAGGYALFVGRLSAEKGVTVLLEAWRRAGDALPPLRVVGDGPLAPEVAGAARALPGVAWLGARSSAEVDALLGDAACLVVPSECYETFGRVVAEAFARGTPVVVADGGAAAELVEPGRTGVHFPSGNASALVAAVTTLVADDARYPRMRAAAREAYERRFTAERNYAELVGLYARARDLRCRPRRPLRGLTPEVA